MNFNKLREKLHWLNLFLKTMTEKKELRRTFLSFTNLERFIFIFLAGVSIALSLSLVTLLHKNITNEIPATRGRLNEGVIGIPRLVNPILANTQADKDLAYLLFSGLTKIAEDGNLVPDLAESFTKNDANTEYIFKLRPDIHFHNGDKLGADDVVFTIKSIQDPLFKSPERANWEGVGISKIDEQTIKFTLKHPYSGFLQNTTVGIIPKKLWDDIAYEHLSFSELNKEPVGSGPYQLKSISKRNKKQNSTTYNLGYFNDHRRAEPYIPNISLTFFEDEAALITAVQDESIDSAFGLSPTLLSKYKLLPENENPENKYNIFDYDSGRIIGLFFNQEKQPLLEDKNIRKAISLAINRAELADKVFMGYSTITKDFSPFIEDSNYEDFLSEDIEKAKKLLSKSGWKVNEETGIREKKGKARLSLNVSTNNSTEMLAIASLVEKELKEIGIDVGVVSYENSELIQEIIPKRNFEVLLFGQSLLHDSQVFAFWHSSQRSDPGLNITGYLNTQADALLEKAITEIDTEKRLEYYGKLSTILKEELPAIFLLRPRYIYLINKSIRGVSSQKIVRREQRFYNLENWYKHSYRVLSIFKKNNKQNKDY